MMNWFAQNFPDRSTWYDYPVLSPETALRTIASQFFNQFKGPCTAASTSTNPYWGTMIATSSPQGATVGQQDDDCCAKCTANPLCEFWVIGQLTCFLYKNKFDASWSTAGYRSAWRSTHNCATNPTSCTLLTALDIADVDMLSLSRSKVVVTFKDDVGEAEITTTVNAYNQALLSGVVYTTTIGTPDSDGAWVVPAPAISVTADASGIAIAGFNPPTTTTTTTTTTAAPTTTTTTTTTTAAPTTTDGGGPDKCTVACEALEDGRLGGSSRRRWKRPRP